MSVKLLTKQNLEFLSLAGGCRSSFESTLAKMPHCRKSHATAHFCIDKRSVNIDLRSLVLVRSQK